MIRCESAKDQEIINTCLNMASEKIKFQKALALIAHIVVESRTGCVEINFTQGGVGSVSFREKIV